MDENDRVVVHIHDPGVRRDRLGNLVRVVRRRNACPDVEELPDAGLARQVPNRPGRKARFACTRLSRRPHRNRGTVTGF